MNNEEIKQELWKIKHQISILMRKISHVEEASRSEELSFQLDEEQIDFLCRNIDDERNSLNRRSISSLHAYPKSVYYVADLLFMNEADLLRKKTFGRKSLKEIINLLAKYNLRLGSYKVYTNFKDDVLNKIDVRYKLFPNVDGPIQSYPIEG